MIRKGTLHVTDVRWTEFYFVISIFQLKYKDNIRFQWKDTKKWVNLMSFDMANDTYNIIIYVLQKDFKECSARALDKYAEKNCRKLKFWGKSPQCPLYVTPQSPQKSPWWFFRKSKMAAKNINYWPLSHFWLIWNVLVYMKAIYSWSIPLFLLITE